MSLSTIFNDTTSQNYKSFFLCICNCPSFTSKSQGYEFVASQSSAKIYYLVVWRQKSQQRSDRQHSYTYFVKYEFSFRMISIFPLLVHELLFHRSVVTLSWIISTISSVITSAVIQYVRSHLKSLNQYVTVVIEGSQRQHLTCTLLHAMFFHPKLKTEWHIDNLSPSRQKSQNACDINAHQINTNLKDRKEGEGSVDTGQMHQWVYPR